jgi:hypothetical protein
MRERMGKARAREPRKSRIGLHNKLQAIALW